MAKGILQVPTIIGGVSVNQTISDNVEEFRYLPRAIDVHDAVYMRRGVVHRASAMAPDQTCIGVVIRIVNSQWCQVLTQGIVLSFDKDMTPNTPYFLGLAAGSILTEPPSGLYHRVQHIGIALNPTDLLINPDLRRFVVTGEPDHTGRLALHWNPKAKQFELGA